MLLLLVLQPPCQLLQLPLELSGAVTACSVDWGIGRPGRVGVLLCVRLPPACSNLIWG